MFGGVQTAAQLMVKVGADTQEAQQRLGGVSATLSKLGGVGQAVGTAMKIGVVGGVAAAGVAVVGLGKVLSDSVGEAMAAQEVMADLNAVLESTKGVSGMTADSVTAISDSLSAVTRFEDDVITAGQSMLLTFTNIGRDVFPMATEAMLNMSTKMGTDVNGAAIQLGKALNNPVEGISALTRVGIQFTDAQKAQIEAMMAAGDIMGAQKVILGELETQFGGAAVAAGQTFAGQMDILQNKLGNIKEEVGMALLPALTTLAQTLGPVLLEAAQGLADFLITTVVPALTTLFVWLGENLPIAIQMLSDFWTNTLQPALATVWAFIEENVIPVLQDVFNWLATNLPPALATLAAFWTNTLLPALTDVWNFIQANVVPILQDVFNWVATNLPPALATLASFWNNTLLPAIKDVWNFIQANVIPIFEDVFNWVATNLPPALETLAGFWNNTLLPAIEDVWDFIQTDLVPLFESLANLTIATVKLALEALKLAWEALKLALDIVWKFVRDNVIPIFVTIAEKLDGPVTTALNALKELLEGAIKTALGVFEGSVNAVKGAIEGITSAIGTVIGWIETLREKLAGLTIPDWLTPGSPTPLELGLIGIGKAFDYAARMAQMMTNSLGDIGDLQIDQELVDYVAVLGAVADGLGRVLSAMLALGAYGGVPLDAKLDALGESIKTVIRALVLLAEYFPVAGGLGSAKAVLDPLAPIFDDLSRIVDALDQITNLELSVANVTLFAENLRTLLPLLVNALVDAANRINLEGLPAAVLFAQAAGDVLGVLRDAVEGLTAAMSYEPPDVDNSKVLIEHLRRFVARLQTMASEMQWKVFDDAIKFAEAAGKMGAALKDGFGGMVAAMTYEAPELDNTDAFFEAMRRFVARLQTMASQMQWKIFDDAIKFAEAAGKVGAALAKGLDLLGDLASYVGPSEDQINAFMRDVRFLFEVMTRWVGLIMAPLLEEISEEMLELMIGLAAAMESALGALTALAGYVTPGQEAIQAFMRDLDELVRQFVAWVTGSRSGPLLLLEVPTELMAIFQAAMQALGAAIATLTALVGYVSPGAAAIEAFMLDMGELVRQFVTWAISSRTGPIMLLDVPPALMEVFRLAMEGMQAAIATLGALVGYVSPGQAAIEAFMADLETVFRRFARWASSNFHDVALDVVRAVGETVGVVFDGLGAAVETLQAMTYYVGPTANNIDRFMADMEQVMIRLRDWAAGAFTLESLAFLRAFGETAGIVFTALGQALDLMSGIAEYTVTGSQFDLALQRFNANLFRMITSWRTWIVDIMEPETLALVADFAGVMTQIVNGFRQALNLLMDLQAANLPTAAELEAFLNAVAALFTAVLDTFQVVTDEVNLMVQRMAMSIAAVLLMLEDVFATFGVNMQTILATMFGDLGALMWGRGDYVAGMFMSGLLRGMQNVNSQNAILDAMISLANQLKAVLMAAWGIHSPSRVAMGIGEQFVAGLARGLMDLQGIPAMIEDAVGISLGGPTVRIEPAPQRAYLTVSFEGAWQSGMNPAEERRITGAMVQELRRQGLVLAAR